MKKQTTKKAARGAHPLPTKAAPPGLATGRCSLSASHVPLVEFGKDHWSTFGYIETRVVDHNGLPERQHLRCIEQRHPFFAHRGGDASKYPTRLRGGRLKHDHDDWDCLDDLEEARLIDNIGTGVNRVYRLTDFGRKVAGQLRGHRGQGGQWDEFFVGLEESGLKRKKVQMRAASERHG
jgi:hypothetical protein